MQFNKNLYPVHSLNIVTGSIELSQYLENSLESCILHDTITILSENSLNLFDRTATTHSKLQLITRLLLKNNCEQSE